MMSWKKVSCFSVQVYRHGRLRINEWLREMYGQFELWRLEGIHTPSNKSKHLNYS